MANPALNEKTFAPEHLRQVDPGFADRVFGPPVGAQAGPAGGEAIMTGPGIAEPADVTARAGRETWRDVMTLDGVVLRGMVLAPILFAAGWFGWQSVQVVDGTVTTPGWILPVLLVGFGIAMV